MNNTLTKGIQLLEVLAQSSRPRGVSELAIELNLGKSLVHRLLQGLVDLNYVQRNDNSGTYSATIRLWEMGSAVLANLDLRRIAEPAMLKLCEVAHETVHLAVLDGEEVVYVHKIETPELVRAYSHIGGRLPAYAVATGKAMLAFKSQAFLESLSTRLKQLSARTITDPQTFLKEMQHVRRHGWAASRGELHEDVTGAGAPITGARGDVIASIGISAPTVRIGRGALTRLAVHVRDAAMEISETLAKSSGHGATAASAPTHLTEERSPLLRRRAQGS